MAGRKKKAARTPDKTQSQPHSGRRERLFIYLLCLFAGLRIFLFSAAFPFFSNVDEQYHFDLVAKYAKSGIPQKIEKFDKESLEAIVLYGSPEYLTRQNPYGDGKISPPLWSLEKGSAEYQSRYQRIREIWEKKINYEDTQPPLYYFIASTWYRLGKLMGLNGEQSLYWIRFMNVPVYVLFLWLSFLCVRRLFPDSTMLRYGIPIMIAVFPQDVFYTINNDVLSPLLFTAAFFCLIELYRSEGKNLPFCIMTGLLAAAAFLNKYSNVAILLLLGLILVLKMAKAVRFKRMASELPKIATVLAAALLPVGLWFARNYSVLNDFTGTAEKTRLLGWTSKPLGEILSHPIFSPGGIITFWHDLMATFWRGELVWHQVRLASGIFDLFYSMSSFFLMGVFAYLLFLRRDEYASERFYFRTSFLITTLSVLFLIMVSLPFDFNDCWYPSRHYPYITSGRLIIGMLVPFLIVYLGGLDYLLAKLKLTSLREGIVVTIALFVMASEVLLNYVVFKSPYNWFHML